MAGNARHVVNMANSIVGVSILSMPYCFKEAGMLLGISLLLLSGFITKKTCMFLVRSAIMARRRSYEFLAFHVFGVSGKLFVEMCMIFFLIGICISFHVVMGDLAPAIVARFLEVENSPSLRCTLLIGIVLLVILPLCLLRNLDSLASMSACSICFYFFLITVILWHAFPKLWDGSWYLTAELWRPAGAFQVLPICSLALACQSNVFEIYDSVPDPDVPKMRSVVNGAVNLCTALYISVGFLGYVAFVDKDLSGNVIMNFPNSNLTEGIKIFFTVSLAISFPLMIFPCRTSIHSLLYRRSNPSSYDLVGNYMPEARFKGITFGILLTSLIVGILIPNIELVLGLLGSTMGMLIALILPSLLFIKVNTKSSTERLIAQGIMLMGLVFIVTGTYINMSHMNEVQNAQVVSPTESLEKMNLDPKNVQIEDIAKPVVAASQSADNSATRKEPVAPEPPPEEIEKKEILSEQMVKLKEPEIKEEKPPDQKEEKNNPDLPRPMGDDKLKKSVDMKDEKNLGDTLHPDAIQKEEKENKEEGNNEKNIQVDELEKKQAELLEKIEEQQQEQKKILAEQKEILKELKDHKNKQEEEAKRKNVEGRENDMVADDAKPVANEQPILQFENPERLGAPQDFKSSLLKENPEPIRAFVAPKQNGASEISQQLSKKTVESVVYQNGQVEINKQQKKLRQEQLHENGLPETIKVSVRDEQISQASNQLPLGNNPLPNNVHPQLPDGQNFNAGVQIPNKENAQAVIDSNFLKESSNNKHLDQPKVENYAPHINSNNIAPSSSLDQLKKMNADTKVEPSLASAKFAKIANQNEKYLENLAEPDQKANIDALRQDIGKAAIDYIEKQNRQAAGLLDEQPPKQRLLPIKVPIIRNYVQEPQVKVLSEPKLYRQKQTGNEFLIGSPGNKQKKLNDKEGIENAKRNKAHDEERRKRHIDIHDDIDFPENDLLKEGVNRDIGDLAYDTRHLLWTHRRRKKKRSNRNHDYQYWDET